MYTTPKFVLVSSQESQVTPPLAVLYTGQEVYIKCYSAVAPQWYYFGKEILFGDLGYDELGSPGYFLRIHNASSSDSGRYICSGTLSNGSSFIAQSRVYIGGNAHSNIYTFIDSIE